jgi:hypothetical protein
MIRIGLLVTVSPILLAFITSLFQGGSMFDEGEGTGTYLWFLMLSIPLGAVIVLIGIIRLILKRR